MTLTHSTKTGSPSPPKRMFPRLATGIGALGLCACALLVVTRLWAPASPWGWGYLAACCGIAGSLVTVRWRVDRRRGFTRMGLLLLLGLGIGRIAFASRNEDLHMVTLPEGGSGRIVNGWLDEQDVVLTATQGLLAQGRLPAREAKNLAAHMATAYARMRKAEGTVPSPFMATYLGLQSPNRFDALVVEPRQKPEPKSRVGVIFLHGFAGGFTLPCWLVGQAVRASVGGVTVCPSVGWRAKWWKKPGRQTVQATMNYLHRRGVKRIFLAGLSDGAIGVSLIAPGLRKELAGAILIAGVAQSARAPGRPALVIHGRGDSMAPKAWMRKYAGLSKRTTYREVPGGHFVLLTQEKKVLAHLTRWLRRQVPQP